MSNSFGTRRGPGRKHVVAQNLGTANFGAGEAEVQARKESTSTTLFKPDTAFNGDPNAFFHTRQWQPLLAHKESLKKARNMSTVSRNLGGVRVQPISSFNRFDHENKSKEEIENEFVCVGFAFSPYAMGENTQVDGGMAAIVTGSFSTVNTGNSIWYPGMTLAWEAYDMRPSDAHKLREWEAKHDRMGGFTVETPRGYAPPVLSEFDLNRDVRMWQINALKAELAAAASSPENAEQLFNFDVLEDPNAVAKLSHRRAWVMRRLRALFFYGVLAGALQGDGVNAEALTGAGFGYLVGGKTSKDRASMMVTMAQGLLGLAPPQSYKFAADITPAAQRALATMFSNAAFDVYNVTADAIAQAVQRVVGFSIDFALPGADGAIVI